MSNYKSPGVYVEERAGSRPIEGAGTSVAAFVGFTPSGPANQPVMITNWSQYLSHFGLLGADGRRHPHMPNAALSHSVQGYFINGGGRCYVTRLLPASQRRAVQEAWNALPEQEQKLSFPLVSNVDGNPIDDATDQTPSLEIGLKSGAPSCSEISIRVEPQRAPKRAPALYGWTTLPRLPAAISNLHDDKSSPSTSNPSPTPGKGASSKETGTAASARGSAGGKGKASSSQALEGEEITSRSRLPLFTLKVSWASHEASAAPIITREFSDLSLYAGLNEVQSTLQGEGLPITVDVNIPTKLAQQLSKLDHLTVKAGEKSLTLPPPSAERTSLKTTSGEYKGSVDTRAGIFGLDIADDVTMVCCPDLALAHRNGLLDDAQLIDLQTALLDHCADRRDRIAILDAPQNLTPQQVVHYRNAQAGFDSPFATLYYPWLRVMQDDGTLLELPPSGHVAGVWARVDGTRGVHKAPANEDIRGVLGVSRGITRREQEALNPIGINCIISFPGRGTRVWGARTLSSDAQWRYLNVRRLFNYVETSIELGTQWVVFEPNDPSLWAKVVRDVSSFLKRIWREGALFGRTESEAFFVRCDEELNPAEVRDAGQLIIEVGIAPVKPAEFVIFRFSQIAS